MLPHKTFTRRGDDLFCDVYLPMTAAALGTTIDLPTLEADTGASASDDTVPIEVLPGTQSGEPMTVRGRGVPRLRGTGRGDLVVRIVVETPSKLDDEQTELLRRLAALRDEERPSGQVVASQKSVFDRLRDAFGAR